MSIQEVDLIGKDWFDDITHLFAGQVVKIWSYKSDTCHKPYWDWFSPDRTERFSPLYLPAVHNSQCTFFAIS